MSRKLIVAAAQLGPNHLSTPRSAVIDRMLNLVKSAAPQNAKLVVFPEIAFTTFFPRYLIEDAAELDRYFEKEGPEGITKSENAKPLFEMAKELGVDVYVGYAERTVDGKDYNTSVYYSAKEDRILSKYRKVHLPGTKEPFADPNATNQLEKRYFSPGDLGFQAFRVPHLIHGAVKRVDALENIKPGTGDPIVGQLICNDRRWPEAWRCYGLQGVELVLCGYNTTAYCPDLLGTSRKIMTASQSEKEVLFHNLLCCQYNSYANSCFSINVAKAGLEDGKPLIGGSCIVDSDGAVVVEAQTKEDELLVAEIDLAECRRGKERMFDFERHRRVEHYGVLVERAGVVEPEFLL